MSSQAMYSIKHLHPYAAPSWAQKLKGIPTHRLKVGPNFINVLIRNVLRPDQTQRFKKTARFFISIVLMVTG